MDTIIVKPKTHPHYSSSSPFYRKQPYDYSSSTTVKFPYKNRSISPLSCSTNNSNNIPEKKNKETSIFDMPESDMDNLFKAVAAILPQPSKMYFESVYYSYKFFKSKTKVNKKLKSPPMFLPRLLLMLFLTKTATQCATTTAFFNLPPSESVKKYKVTINIEEIK